MKDDLEVPDVIPRKRRALEAVPDLFLAVWLDRDDLGPSERRRLQDEKERRRDRTVPVVLGFTGTRAGMTPQQRAAVRDLIATDGVVEARHGDCVGADEQFHALCLQAGVTVVVHPPKDQRLRAWCRSGRVLPAEDYLARDRAIVQACSLLIATPKEGREPPPGTRSGTWYTVRYARQRDKPVKVIMPGGVVLGEEVAA